MADQRQLALLQRSVKQWNSWREEDLTVRPDLSAARLSGENLSYANFSDTDLASANLTAAILTRANFFGANLQASVLDNAYLLDADFRRADMGRADCSDANLRGANLRYAILDGANLSGANLCRADLSDARLLDVIFSDDTLLGGTSFCKVDLSKTSGLRECGHIAPSSVDTHTLLLSPGLPEEFLRGCGLTDWEIEAAKLYHESRESRRTEIMNRVLELRRGQPVADFYSVFISYSHADREFAEMLHDDIQKRGVRCWRDEHQMLPGDDIYERIDHGVRHWDKIILLASEASLTSWWVDNELDTAFEKERVLMKERGQKTLAVIPLDLDGYFLSDRWQSGKKRQLQSRVAGDFTDWKPGQSLPEDRIEQLIRALRTNDAGREAPPEPKL